MRHGALDGLLVNGGFIPPGFIAGGGNLSLRSHPSDLRSERWEIAVAFCWLQILSVARLALGSALVSSCPEARRSSLRRFSQISTGIPQPIFGYFLSPSPSSSSFLSLLSNTCVSSRASAFAGSTGDREETTRLWLA